MTRNNLLSIHNVGIVVESLDNVISFFTEMVTPDGNCRLELSRFIFHSTV